MNKCAYFDYYTLFSQQYTLFYDVENFLPVKIENRSIIANVIYFIEVKTKDQYWPLTCNTNHNTMFDMQAVNI